MSKMYTNVWFLNKINSKEKEVIKIGLNNYGELQLLIKNKITWFY